jgi:hypothetical protein
MLFVVPIIDACGLNPEPTHCSTGRQESEIWHEQSRLRWTANRRLIAKSWIAVRTSPCLTLVVRNFGTLRKVTV